MRIIDKNSKEYLEQRDFYKRMFEKTIKTPRGLLNQSVEHLLDIGRLKTNGLYIKDDLDFSSSVAALGDLGKLIAATTMMGKTVEKGKTVVDDRKDIADTMLDLIPDFGYYYPPLMTAAIGRKYFQLHKDSDLAQQIYRSYGLINSDEGINYGDTMMGLIAINRLITLYEEFRTLSFENPEDKNNANKIERLEELKKLARVVVYYARDIYGSGKKGLEGLLEKPLSEEERVIFDKEELALFSGPAPGVNHEADEKILNLITKIDSDAPMSEVYAAVRDYSQWTRTKHFEEVTHFEDKRKMIEGFDDSLSIDDVYPRLAAAYYYLRIYETMGPKILNYSHIYFDEERVWTSPWETYTADSYREDVDKAIMRCLNGPCRNLSQICSVNGWIEEDKMFEVVTSKGKRPLSDDQLERLAITCSLLNNSNVTLKHGDKIVGANNISALAEQCNNVNSTNSYRYILQNK